MQEQPPTRAAFYFFKEYIMNESEARQIVRDRKVEVGMDDDRGYAEIAAELLRREARIDPVQENGHQTPDQTVAQSE